MRLGVCWYPEQWPESRWPTDLAMMRDAGLTLTDDPAGAAQAAGLDGVRPVAPAPVPRRQARGRSRPRTVPLAR